MSEEWDVIVVGAGPAGSTAAGSSASSGAKTLLIEARSEIKAWKPCGEGVSKATFRTAGIDPAPGIVSKELSMRVYAPNGRFVEITEKGYAINKDLFLLELARKAAEQGSEIRVGEPVRRVSCKEDRLLVQTSRDTYITKVVIGADGFNSVVAKSLGMDNRTELIPVYQYRMTGLRIDATCGHIYLGNELAPGGYAWIFPKSDKIFNVGIGVRSGDPRRYLDKFISERRDIFGSAKILGAAGSAVPIGGLAKEIVNDGIILIGDAAGTVIPFTGGGIHSSIAAGKIAGEVAAEAVSEGSTSKRRLSRFIEGYRDPWIKRIRDSLKALRVFEGLSDNDLNTLAEVLSEEDVVNLANGINITKTAKKLLSHPVLSIKVARKLLF